MAAKSKKTTTTNGKQKRQSPSVERQIALALVRMIECVIAVGTLGMNIKAGDTTPEYEQAQVDRKMAIDEARKVLESTGYGDLESIQSRVAALENQLTAAISLRDGKAVAKLGAELERAKTGRPPITPVKKAKAPKEPKANNQPKLLPDDKAEGAAAGVSEPTTQESAKP